MALSAGTKLGPYEVISAIGAGGMGEVYRARDTRLGREVAIKVLPEHLSSNPDLKARFEREAKAISSLSHPHICTLHDVGHQDGTDFLVMEFLEGETLAERLQKGAMPFHDVLQVGRAIAEALAVAHRHGIVHRDLKPGNIMLSRSGAKLMDFGLAKPVGVQSATVASGSAPSFTAAATLSSPSPMSPLTTAGSIVGTIQYMSPEQIEGKEADARSDIFAFGTVLYEMAAGRRPFVGKSQLSLASSILESDPQPISTIQPSITLAFVDLVTGCLRKNPEERFQSAHDIRLQLESIAAERPAVPSSSPLLLPARKRERIAWAAALVAAVILSVLGTIFYRPAEKLPTVRTVLDPPEKTSFALTGDAAGPPVLSPDGTLLAFTATRQDGKTSIWVRLMNSSEARALPNTDGAIFPFWSPDSKAIGFFADGELKSVDLSGGSALAICDAQLGRGGTWGPNGVILFSANPSSPIMRVSATGGTPAAITRIDTTQHTSHRWPFFLPDGKHFLYAAIHHDASKAANNAIYYASLDGSQDRLLFRSQSNAIYAGGFVLFARGDQLVAQAFDPAEGKLAGQPQTVAKGMMNDSTTWHADASAAINGLLVFGSGESADLQLVWLDRASKQVSTIAGKFSNLQLGQVSPQGDRIALQVASGANDIWVLDLTRGVNTRLTFGPVANIFPVWSPDGKWIAYSSTRNNRFGIYRKPSDGSGVEELLFQGGTNQLEPDSWSRDGEYLIYTERAQGGLAASSYVFVNPALGYGSGQLWALPLSGERKPQSLVQKGGQARLSPDGHWLAYNSSESGAVEVYVVPFGGGQGKWQISSTQGALPRWSGNGKELFYSDPAYNLFAVPVKEVGGTLQFGAATPVTSSWGQAPQFFYDVAPDGEKILLDRVALQVSQSVSVITNWTAGVKK